MTINKKLCPAGLASNPNRPLKSIDYITIHCTGNYNPTATAKAHANLQYNGNGGNKVSWHFSVDNDEVWQSYEDNQGCWHAGDGGNGQGNTTSISVEICVNDKTSFPKACDNAARLTAELLRRHDLSIDRVVQHNKWSGKNCPAELRSGTWGVSWDGFINLVKCYSSAGECPTQQKEQAGTLIMGVSALTAEQLATYLLSKNTNPKINCSALELARYFIEEGNIEGVRGDIAFFQSAHETGWFKYGGLVLPEQNNYAGIGATNNSDVGKGAWFDTPQIGVRAQIHHLKAYASKEPLMNVCASPRFHLVTRGCAPAWEYLNGRWAVPGTTYGQSILKLYNSALEFAGVVSPYVPPLDVNTAINILLHHGVLNSPDYWLAKYDTVEHLDTLIINMAAKLLELPS